jgi:WD40 repeat protein
MADRVGQQLGNYRLISLLGKGGFADVYLGEHVYLGTQAALKIMNAQLATQDFEEFRKEARILAQLIYPSIVRLLDFGIDGATPFLVLDYAPNGTLRQRHPKGTQLPLPTLVEYVNQVAAALQYAHERKVIHRDVKPENMLLGRRNEVVLTDFGLAIMAPGTLSIAAEQIVGSVGYIAPEQILGKPRLASDQYSLAVVVYEWLSGKRPFDGASFLAVASQHLYAAPPALRQTVPMIPPAVEQVVLKALAKDPLERFPTVQAFAIALEQASASPQRVFALSSQPSVQTQPMGTVICSYRQHSASVCSLSWSPDSTQIVSVSGDKMVQVWDAMTGRTLRLYQDIAESVRLVAWCPGGMRLATAGSDAYVRVWEMATNRLLATYQGHSGSTINAIVWSPKQELLASAGDDGTIHVWNALTGQSVTIYSGHSGSVYAAGWSLDGKRLVSGGDDTLVQVWEAFTGKPTAIYRGQSSKVLSTAWSPDMQRVACGREDGTVQKWEVATNREVLLYRSIAPISVVAWSPEGRRFAFASGDNTVQVWDTLTNRRLFIFQHTAPVRVMAWSPDGKSIASGGDDAAIQVWIAP